jgi:hypothetical protein
LTSLIVALAWLAAWAPQTPASASATSYRVTDFRYRSEAGDWIGQGASGVVADPAPITLAGDRHDVVAGVAADGGWRIELRAPVGEKLRPGVYVHAERASFVTGRSPGLDVSTSGRGCNQVFGRFALNQIRTDANGNVIALDVRFLQRCEASDAPALHGLLRVAVAPLSYRFTSDVGDYIGGGARERYEGATTLFGYYEIYANGVRVKVSGQGDEWWIWLAPPAGDTLAVGHYAGAQRAPFQQAGHPGLDVSGNGRGCNTSSGWFDISAIVFDPNGVLTRLAVTFEQHCEDQTPALHGTLRFHA